MVPRVLGECIPISLSRRFYVVSALLVIVSALLDILPPHSLPLRTSERLVLSMVYVYVCITRRSIRCPRTQLTLAASTPTQLRRYPIQALTALTPTHVPAKRSAYAEEQIGRATAGALQEATPSPSQWEGRFSYGNAGGQDATTRVSAFEKRTLDAFVSNTLAYNALYWLEKCRTDILTSLMHSACSV